MLDYVTFMVECELEDAKRSGQNAQSHMEKNTTGISGKKKEQSITAQDFDQWAQDVEQEDENMGHRPRGVSEIDTRVLQRMQARLGVLRLIRRQERKKLRK